MTRARIAILLLTLSLPSASLAAQPAQWSRLKIDQVYEHWNLHNGTNNPIDDVISLRPPPDSFINQSVANPHVVIPDGASGDWLVVCYGNRLAGLADSIYVFTRHGSNGDYVVPSAEALTGKPSHGLGAGAAVLKAPAATPTGRKIFALVPVLGSTGWLTWASLDSNGTTWSFLGANGSATTDPLQSVKLIARTDTAGRWQHPAIVSANVLGVDYFFISVGYASDANATCGIPAIWFRLQFDASNPFGLKTVSPNVPKAQRWTGSAYVDTAPAGQVTNAEACAGAAPGAGGDTASDPMDLVSLKKSDGSFDSILFVYVPAGGGYRDPKRIMYTKAALPTTATGNLQFGPLRVLDTSVLWDRATFPLVAHTYSSCGSGGGNYMSVNQGAPPLTAGLLIGFIAGFRRDMYSSVDPGCFWNCVSQPEGLLPVLLKQQSLGVDSISPLSGPRTGGTAITVQGEGFLSTPTVSLGGSAVSGVTVTGGTKITGTTTAHASGVTSLKVVNPNPNAEADVKTNSFVFDFDDVSASHPYHDYVTTLARSQVTAGCGANTYCPDNPVTRAQMAVFMLTGRYGSGYPPPPPPPARPGEPTFYFTDVPATNLYAKWIDEIFRMGITAGCAGTGTCALPNGSTQYCPDNPIPREQMAVFLLNTAHYTGNPYAPPDCAGSGITLPDVACPSQYANYIYEVVKQGMMLKCGTAPFVCAAPCQTGDFCPGAAVTRKDMAQHLDKAFGLQ